MPAGSARSLSAVLEKTDEVLLAGADAGQLGDELFALAVTMDTRHSLRRALTEPAVPAETKGRLLHTLLRGKISDATFEVVGEAVQHRWSQGSDLGDALERASVTAQVARADQAGHLDELEDNLFRFGRIVDANPELRDVLSEGGYPLEAKQRLLDDLLGGRVDEPTRRLLGQAVAARHRSLTVVLETYQKVAADRRSRLVATVWVAGPLSEDHKERLARALSAEYDHDIHLNVIIEPEVLGGVRVAVGDEVIDSTVETRLKQARRRLEH
jgi:F-type H+-transporting ATPase subunit delta